MAYFKRKLTLALREMSKQARGVQSLTTLVASLTTRHQLQHAKLTQIVRVLLRDNPRALGWVPLEHDTYISYHDAVDGVVFRIIPDQSAIDGDYILREWLEPFVPEDIPIYLAGAKNACQPQGPDVLSVHGWYDAQSFVHGDHIVAQVKWHERCELTFTIDRMATMHLVDTVLAVQHIATHLHTHWQDTLGSDALYLQVLAMYATAPWRSAYPAMPWQYIINAQATEPIILTRLELLRLRIHELQQTLRQRRVADSNQGLWDGIALRYSAVRMFLDAQYDDAAQRILPVDTRLDHSLHIDDAIARGVYDVQYADDNNDAISDADWDWFDKDPNQEESYTAALQSSNDDADDDDADDESALINDDEAIEDETFVALFAHRHPAVRTASIQLLKALNENERRMLIRAESVDDHNAILAAAMQRVLPTMPHLMRTLWALPVNIDDHTQGGMTYAAFERAEQLATQRKQSPDTATLFPALDASADGDAVFVIELALRESRKYIEAYEQWLRTQRPSTGSQRHRMRALNDWALFVAQYYTTTLNDATYAMLDEYFYFHYPRHTSSGSARTLRARIGYVRDYYVYRASLGDTRVLAAAQAIYTSRHHAADVLDVLLRIQQYPQELTALVVHLFAPYTV